MTDTKTIPCSICGNPMPELRLTRCGFDYCVNCSTEKPKVARTTTFGEGDHTWTEIQILDSATAHRLSELEKTSTPITGLEFDHEDMEDSLNSFKREVKSYIEKRDEQLERGEDEPLDYEEDEEEELEIEEEE